ncbi:MAG TPA: MDR family MFS transporter, partial [Micromonosporaceae bacterium]|nr:MDR family MFS transporter [Micromonosporaceae bacterium]
MTTTAEAVQARPQLSHRQILLLMGGLMTGMLLAALDQTIVGTALPTIVGDLKGINHYSWVVTAYLLASTASTPLYGKISDLYGRRKILLFSIITFMVGSLLAGASQNMTELIITRGIQGLGAGGLMTLAFTIISDVVAPRDRGRYMGIFGAVFGLSSIAGPLVGGYFAQLGHSGWRWIFYINVPLAILAVIVCNQVLRMVPHTRRDHRIDYLGAVLMVVSVVSLLLALSFGGTPGWAWGSANVIGLLIAAVVFGVAFVFAEARASEPILPLHLFQGKTFNIANGATFILGAAMFGSVIFVPLYLQIVKGATPTQSGLLMLPMMVGVIVTSIVTGRWISKAGHYKWFPVAGTALMSLGLLMFISLKVDTPLWQAFIFMLVVGIGLGSAMQPLVLAIQNDLPMADMGAGTAASTFFRSLGGAVGVAALGAVLTNKLSVLGGGATGGGSGVSVNDPASIKALPPAAQDFIHHVFVDALHPIFLIAGVVAALAVLLSLILPDH